MNRILLVVACALAACEGEPLKMGKGASFALAQQAPAAASPVAEDAGAVPAAASTEDAGAVLAAASPEVTRALAALLAEVARTVPATPPAVAAASSCAKEGDAGSAVASTADAAARAPGPAQAEVVKGRGMFAWSPSWVPAPVPAPAEVAKASLTGRVTTVPAGNAGNAVVYLADAPIEPTAKMSVTVDNRSMTFAPYVAVIPVGGRVVFHNSDPFPHNVFSPDNEKFDIGNVSPGAATTRTFKMPGSYTILCDLYPEMIGYVVATPSSYFGKTDGKGRYTIKDVPPGRYKVVAWAPRQQPLEESATLSGTDVTLDFQLHP